MDNHSIYAALYLERVRQNDPICTKLEYPGRNFQDSDAQRLAEAMVGNTHVQILRFEDNELSTEGFKHIVGALKENRTVTELRFDGNHVTTEGCALLVDLIRHFNHVITSVSLSRNPIEEAVLGDLTKACMLNTEPLPVKQFVVDLEEEKLVRTLVLSDPPSSARPYTMATTKLLCSILLNNDTLTSLDFSCNNLGDEKTALIAEVLKEHRLLREVKLQRNRISCEGAISLATAITSNYTLTSLDLYDNIISDQGAQAFINMLRRNNVIAYLNLKLNNVSLEKMEKIAHGLMMNSQPLALKNILPELQLNNITIKRVVLSEYPDLEAAAVKRGVNAPIIYQVNDVTCRVLYNALRSNNTVEFLDLSNNKITDDGAIQIAQLLKLNKTISTLLLNNNQIGDVGLTAILGVLEEDSAVRRFEIRGNPLIKNTRLLEKLATVLELNNEPWLFKKLAPKLHDNDPGYKILDFSQLGEETFTSNTCRLLCTVLQANTSVIQLILANNPNMGLDGLTLITNMLGNGCNGCVNLQLLDLSGCNIGDEGFMRVLAMLYTRPNVREVLLRENKITTSAAAFVLPLVRQPASRVVTMDLTGNEGVELALLRDIALAVQLNRQLPNFKRHLVELLANSADVVELDLCESQASGQAQYRYAHRYDDDAVALLCSALRANTVARTVNLAANRITDVGANHIADLLLFNQTLTSLNLNYNHITDKGLCAIVSALEVNNKRVVFLSCEGQHVGGADVIQPATRAALTQVLLRNNAASAGDDGFRYDAVEVFRAGHSAVDTESRVETEILRDALTATTPLRQGASSTATAVDANTTPPVEPTPTPIPASA